MRLKSFEDLAIEVSDLFYATCQEYHSCFYDPALLFLTRANGERLLAQIIPTHLNFNGDGFVVSNYQIDYFHMETDGKLGLSLVIRLAIEKAHRYIDMYISMSDPYLV